MSLGEKAKRHSRPAPELENKKLLLSCSDAIQAVHGNAPLNCGEISTIATSGATVDASRQVLMEFLVNRKRSKAVCACYPVFTFPSVPHLLPSYKLSQIRLPPSLPGFPHFSFEKINEMSGMIA